VDPGNVRFAFQSNRVRRGDFKGSSPPGGGEEGQVALVSISSSEKRGF